jgi:hypothetical protein
LRHVILREATVLQHADYWLSTPVDNLFVSRGKIWLSLAIKMLWKKVEDFGFFCA